MTPHRLRDLRIYRVATQTFTALFRDEILVEASAMAFWLFLALIPLLALSGSLLGGALHGDPRALSVFSALLRVAPDEVKMLVDRQLERGSAEAFAPLFLSGSLWLAAGAFHDAMTACETAHRTSRRTWLHKRLLALGCVLGLLAGLLASTWALFSAAGGLASVIEAILERTVAYRPSAIPLVLGCFVAWLLLGAFFRIAARYREERPPLWPGATVTLVSGVLTSTLFASYARELASYTVFYGSLAAVAVFLLWLWVLCASLLLGVEVNAVLGRGT